MAEKGILIADQNGGESVACRDAVQQDENLNPRVIQLVDLAARPGVFHETNPSPVRRTVIASDPLNLDPLPSGVGDTSSSRLDLSDASGFVFFGEATIDSQSFFVTVTPILLSDGASPVAKAAFPPVLLQPVSPSKGGTGTHLRLSSSAFTNMMTQIVHYPSMGAKQVAFHLTFSAAPLTFIFSAHATSFAGRIQKIEEEFIAGTWGGIEFASPA